MKVDIIKKEAEENNSMLINVPKQLKKQGKNST